MAKILIVDDDPDLLDLISQSLSFELYVTETAVDGDSATVTLRTKEFDLVILDLELPQMSGLEVCRRYRTLGGKTPVLMLTGKTQIMDRVKGLESGADDYLTKPFDIDELIARVRALLRRTGTNRSSNSLIYQDIILEPNNYQVTKSGRELRLIPKEFGILELLMRNPGKVFSTEKIIDRIWHQSDFPETDVIRTHIMNLRKKLGNKIIETVHGVGYRVPPAGDLE